jgi:hypothetical protein
MRTLKCFCLVFIPALVLFISLSNNPAMKIAGAYATGPPAGVSAAPGESSCLECHLESQSFGGSLNIGAPATYVAGQTYVITVTHVSGGPSRKRWGFQLTALAGATSAGTLQNLSPQTQILSGGGRTYIEHTFQGTFANQSGGAQWSFNWTAPPTNVGAITFYAAGNQANNDGTNGGDDIIFVSVTSEAGAAASPTPTPTVQPSPTATATATPTPEPTPGSVTVAGRVLTSNGLGLRNATVTLVDPVGNSWVTSTSTLGFYSFQDVPTNQQYNMSVRSKRYRFEEKIVNVNAGITDLDFIGLE